MRLERIRPTVLRMVLHAHELATLMTAVRYVAETGPAEVPESARQELRALLRDYDQQLHHLGTSWQQDDPDRSRAG
ncbi:hypothetical protein CDG81_12075 [Actinopolyspora erythraea]|uniref:Uncharacterized protein n=1 Tax=Actinopolyspora erythraea TaxID=414996 RepID=A0A099D5Y1_9ACTN|nr:hypothetical protein [Actinopolyspora erythraea]ASU78894.1 hypothetical protein CDG81_12075 [Actinopolyspora erythraea]KGI81242.1 hypothetical protein IL38_12155 [Actinopolyspora erythraea]